MLLKIMVIVSKDGFPLAYRYYIIFFLLVVKFLPPVEYGIGKYLHQTLDQKLKKEYNTCLWYPASKNGDS